MDHSLSRREFAIQLGAASTSILAAGYTATSFGFAANETINIGCLGCGGRFRHLAGALARMKGIRIAAVCDVYDDHLDQAKKIADSKALVTKAFPEVLARPDIDAVLIAAPDHWHVPMTIAACAAGKDVYVEKPLTHDLSEGRAVVDAQNRHQRIVQVGMQQRSMPQFQEGLQIVRSGQLGKIHKVHLTWNRNQPRGTQSVSIDPSRVDWNAFLGNARKQPFNPYRFRQWRWFWDFGGGILTDLMTHFIDVAHWYLDLDAPATAATTGDNYQTKGLWETPDTMQTILNYPDKELQVYFEGSFVNARNAAMIEFMGRDATLYLDRGRYEIHPEAGKGKYQEKVLGSGGRGADFYVQPDGELLHLSNWIECIRNRNKPNAPAEAGVSAVIPGHLGNLAYRNGQVAKYSGG
ncbi:MAG: Gfo/Idh/MocA family oxidoreductase [Planctomycetota bacterium]